MGQVVNTNMSSITAQKNLNRSSSAMQTTMARLSSGLRINSAKDDAAGLAISERQTAQIRGMSQAIRNTGDATSLLETAESGLVQITELAQRIRELAVQGANGTYGTSDLTKMGVEVTALKSEMDRIAQTTDFNGLKVIDVDAGATSFQVGANANETISITTVDAGSLGAGLTTITTSSSAQTLIGDVDTVLDTIATQRATYGAGMNRVAATAANLENVREATSGARSRIRDADFASETATLARTQVLQQAGVAMLSQANASSQSVLTLLQ